MLALPIGAQDAALQDPSTQIPNEFENLFADLPQELINRLPSSIFSEDINELSQGVREISNFSYLIQALLSTVGLSLGPCVAMLSTVCGLLLLSAVFNAIKQSFRSDTVGRAFSFLSSLVIMITILSQGYQSTESVSDYFQTLSAITKGLIPLMGGVYAMGGNLSASVASSAALSVFLAVLQEIVVKSILPFCGICMAFALMRALDPGLRLGTLSDTLKKNYTTLIAFLMMLLSAMLAAQTTLGAASDSIAMRSAKFAAGNLIPVVGGSVAELLRTISAGVGYLRTTVGLCGVLLVLLFLFPMLVKLFLLRLTWQLSASFADLLGCDREKKLLEEFSSIMGYLIAAVSICSSVLLLAMILLACCATAIG